MENISIIGLGKLGLPMAACLAYKGYQIIGVDLDGDIVKAVNDGISPNYEPGIHELLKKSQERLFATTDYGYAVEHSEVTFIFVPTPTNEEGDFSSELVQAAIRSVAAVLNSKDAFHLIVIRSTVIPGTTKNVVTPLIESISGRRCGVDFGLCYNPEFLAVGSAIKNLLNPDVIVIGESDSKSGELLSIIYQKVCNNNPPIVRTNIYNAELAKISLNTFITMKISFANIIAELCEQIPGGDVDKVSEILGFDSRIGRKYLTGGLAYSGPCFPRDNKAFAFTANKVGCKTRIPEVIDQENIGQIARVICLVKRELKEIKDKEIAILGLTYKPDTDIIDPSASTEIAKALLQEGARVSVYDPAGMRNARQILGENKVRYADSVQSCLINTEFCILATPWEEFRTLKPEDFMNYMSKPILLDCWRILDRSEYTNKIKYAAIGVGPTQGSED